MKIAIVGIGKFGRELANHLSKENHNIVAIDENAQNIETAVNELDILGYVGNGASFTVQQAAGIQGFDILIAVTGSDETNILTCQVARLLGIKTTICRTRNNEYTYQLSALGKKLGVDYPINPDELTANELKRVIRFPSAIKVESFAEDLVDLVEIKLEEDSVLNGLTLSEMRRKYKVPLLVSAVQRGNDVYIPRGDFKLEEGDFVYMTVANKEIYDSFRKFNIISAKIKSVFIIGAGKTSQMLASEISHMGMSVKIFDRDQKRCEKLSEEMKNVLIIHADVKNQKALLEEGLDQADCLVTLTNVDETNIIISAYAKNLGVDKVITKISNIDFDLVINNLGLDTVISPKEVFASEVIRIVRTLENAQSHGSAFNSLYRLVQNRVEATEFTILEKTQFTSIALKNLKMEKNCLLASIIRGEDVILPGGNDTIEVGDKVVIISANGIVKDVGDLFS